MRHGDAACFGPQAEAFFGDFYTDKAFLGSGGVHAQVGLTDYHPPLPRWADSGRSGTPPGPSDLTGIPRRSPLLIILAVPFFVLPLAAKTILRPHDDRRDP